MKRIAAGLVAAALAFSLAACSSPNDKLSDLYKQGNDQGFISGSGTIEEYPVAARRAPITFTGKAVDGSVISSSDYKGTVLVINFWYAGCGPCRAEAPVLEATNKAVSASGAKFLGINIYDGSAQATSFEKQYGITYPSLLARTDAALKLSFIEATSVQSAPTTLVLDREGRVSARIFGAVESSSILKTLVDSAAKGTP